MRLFIAINFDGAAKSSLLNSIQSLKAAGLKGNFTKKENLHLTLVFLGETPAERLGLIRSVMNRVDSAPFDLILDGLGRFRRGEGELIWVGVQSNNLLNHLQNGLKKGLQECGFLIENREFKPHLTLARSVKGCADSSFSEYRQPAFSTTVNAISLMKSERINGVLTYSEVYAKKLTAE